MGYIEEKSKLITMIKEKYGITIDVADDEEEEKVIAALSMMVEKKSNPVSKEAESAFLRFVEGRTIDDDPKIEKLSESIFGKNEVRGEYLLFLIASNHSLDEDVISILTGLIGKKNLILRRDSKELLLIIHTIEDYSKEDLHEMASRFTDTLGMEALTTAYIAYDHAVLEIKYLPEVFMHAKTALRIGRKLYPQESVFSYHELGTGKMLDSLSLMEKEDFLKDQIGTFRFASLDHEMMVTIRTFFETNLSVTESAKRLFIHRNTLIYRLDKFEKLSGLDLRKFYDAMVTHLAMEIEQLL